MINTGRKDHLRGAFLEYLISNRVEPTLFEAGANSKITQFTIKDKDYKAFVKYCASPRKSQKGVTWNTEFTKKEVELLKQLHEKDRENIIVIVCTDHKFQNTLFAVLPEKVATQCLGKDRMNQSRRVSIYHEKNSRHFNVYGTAVDKTNSYRVRRNCDKYFGF